MRSLSQSLANWLRPLIEIRPEERMKTLLMFIYFLSIIALIYILKPVRSSLFLDELGAQYLRFAYMGEGLFLIVMTTLYIQFAKRVSKKIFYWGTLIFFISNLEIDKALECFAKNIVVEIADYGVREGKEAVSKFFREVIHRNVSGSKEGHFTGQPVISIDGQKAEGHWMFYRFVPQPSEIRWIQGRYDCEYIIENGKWKFSRMKLTRPWPAFFGEND